MVYIEIKTIKGRKYKYERKSIRQGKRVIHLSKYIAAVEPIKQKKSKNVGRKPRLRVKDLTQKSIILLSRT